MILSLNNLNTVLLTMIPMECTRSPGFIIIYFQVCALEQSLLNSPPCMVISVFVAVEFSPAAFRPSSSLFGEAPIACCLCSLGVRWGLKRRVGISSWVASCNPGLSLSVSSLPGVTKL